MTQRDKILMQLKKGCSVTPLDALYFCGSMRLGARILELRQKGYDIKTTIINRDGSHFARYSLVK